MKKFIAIVLLVILTIVGFNYYSENNKVKYTEVEVIAEYEETEYIFGVIPVKSVTRVSRVDIED